MSLLCLLLDSILAPCSLPLAARACRSTAFQPPCIFILDKPLAGCTVFFSPSVPRSGGPAFSSPHRKPASQAATGRFRGPGWGRVATWRESPHNRPHRGKQRGTGRAGLSPLPLPVYIAISGLSWSSSHHWPGRAGHFLLHYLCAVILQRQPGLLLAVSFHLSPEKLFFCWIERI